MPGSTPATATSRWSPTSTMPTGTWSTAIIPRTGRSLRTTSTPSWRAAPRSSTRSDGASRPGGRSERFFGQLHQVERGLLDDAALRRQPWQHGLGEETRGGELALVEGPVPVAETAPPRVLAVPHGQGHLGLAGEQ